jgi:hydroxymethylpyrimidine pyrophosphatase-like HAD family hydrolase
MTARRGRFRLLALDIDGTLLRSDKTISPRTLLALRAAREQGVRLVLVTGRRLPAARRAAEALGDVDLVLHNGALIVENGVVLRCRPLSRELARRAIRIGRGLAADPVVHAGRQGEGRLLVEGVQPSNTLLAYYIERSHPDVFEVDDLEDALDDDPLQVMFGGRRELMEELLPVLERDMGAPVRIERTVYPDQGVGILDVLAPGVNKAEAVTFLQERWRVAADETLAVGDNWNDLEMLQQAGLGMVMGNADPDLRARGFPVLPTNDEDGVAVAVEKHVLNK